jgi:hypothetical protein
MEKDLRVRRAGIEGMGLSGGNPTMHKSLIEAWQPILTIIT